MGVEQVLGLPQSEHRRLLGTSMALQRFNPINMQPYLKPPRKTMVRRVMV